MSDSVFLQETAQLLKNAADKSKEGLNKIIRD